MPMTIVSGNLNQYGNAGQFESDRSTWGFSNDPSWTAVRSNLQKTSGLYSCLITRTSLSSLGLIPYAFPGVIGKKYLIKAKVRVPSGALPADGASDITLTASIHNFMFGMTEISHINKTVAEATDTWVDVEIQVNCTSSSFSTNYSGILWINASPALGQIFVDQLEIYEFTGEDDGGPEPPEGIVQFDNNLFSATMAPWQNVNPDDGAPWVYDAGDSVIADGITLNKEKTGFIAGITNNAGPWPPGDYVVEVVAENLSTGGLNIAGVYESVRIYTSQNTFDAPTFLKVGPAFTRIAGDQTKLITFTLEQSWTYLLFIFRRPIGGGGLKVKFNVKSITVIDGPVPSEIEPPAEIVADQAFLSKNPITYGLGGTSGWESIDNYRLFNEVRVEDEVDSGVYNSKIKLELYPALTGSVVFYLNEAFRDCFSFTPPTLNQATMARLTDRIKRFKNYNGELQGDEVSPEITIPSDPHLVLYGGVNKYTFPGFNYLTEYLPTNKKFLTWAPVEKYVDRAQEDYLNFWVYDDTIGTLKLQLKAYFDDATDQTQVVATLEGILHKALYQIPAGPANTGVLTINAEKTVTKYELSLLDQDDTVISEVRTYHIAATRHPLTRFFMFLNSLGSYEVLRFTGQAIEETEFVRETVQKFLPHDYQALDGEFETASTLIQPRLNFSSGHIKGRLAAQWHNYMKDFLRSPRVFDVTNGSRIPMVITEGIFSKEDQNYNRFIRFTAKPAYDDEMFTPDL